MKFKKMVHSNDDQFPINYICRTDLHLVSLYKKYMNLELENWRQSQENNVSFWFKKSNYPLKQISKNEAKNVR